MVSAEVISSSERSLYSLVPKLTQHVHAQRSAVQLCQKHNHQRPIIMMQGATKRSYALRFLRLRPLNATNFAREHMAKKYEIDNRMGGAPFPLQRHHRSSWAAALTFE